jgi:hypothetical protein
MPRSSKYEVNELVSQARQNMTDVLDDSQFSIAEDKRAIKFLADVVFGHLASSAPVSLKPTVTKYICSEFICVVEVRETVAELLGTYRELDMAILKMTLLTQEFHNDKINEEEDARVVAHVAVSNSD